ncbi:MAG: hypothetical protein WD768_16900, partial [Phycisphaeraceae bacterium]
MGIKLSCSGCGSTFAADDRLAGRKVKCPKCKAAISVPGGDGSASSRAKGSKEPAPSMGIDWDLMVESAQPIEEEEDRSVKTDPDAVDWDALAGDPAPGKPAVKKESRSATGFASPAEQAGHAGYDPRAQHAPPASAPAGGSTITMGGRDTKRMEQFFQQVMVSPFFSIAYLPQTLTLLLIFVVLQVTFWAALYLSRPLYLEQEAWVFELTFGLAALFLNLIYHGYLQRYYMGVAAVTSQGGEAFGLPDFSVPKVLRSLGLAILFVLVYIVPIITIPLAPIAYLIISRTQDLRGFDVPWVAKMTARYFLQSLTVIIYCILSLIVLALVVYLMFRWTLGAAIWFMPRQAVGGAIWLILLLFLVLLQPLIMAAMATLARMVGLIGRHGEWMLRNVPQRTNLPVVLLGAPATCVIGLLITSLYLPKVGDYISARVLKEAGDYAQSNPNAPRNSRGRTNPGQYVPPVVVDPFADLATLSPEEQVQLLLKHARLGLTHQQPALRRLATLRTDVMRGEVIAALEMVIRTNQSLSVQNDALNAYDHWQGDKQRLLIITLGSGSDLKRREAVTQALHMAVADVQRSDVVLGLERALQHEQSSTERAKVYQALSRWSRDPAAVL